MDLELALISRPLDISKPYYEFYPQKVNIFKDETHPFDGPQYKTFSKVEEKNLFLDGPVDKDNPEGKEINYLYYAILLSFVSIVTIFLLICSIVKQELSFIIFFSVFLSGIVPLACYLYYRSYKLQP